MSFRIWRLIWLKHLNYTSKREVIAFLLQKSLKPCYRKGLNKKSSAKFDTTILYEEGFVMKDYTEVVFILDRSGSMEGLEKDTIGGFNSMLKEQKKAAGDAVLSAVLFDDKTEVLYDRVSIKDVKKMTEKQYFTRGCTALLDALGGAIHHIGNVHKYAREEDRPEKTIFIISIMGPLWMMRKEICYCPISDICN